MLEKPEFAGNY